MNDERVRKLVREELRKLLAIIFHAAESHANMHAVTSDPYAPGESELKTWGETERHRLLESSASRSNTGTDGATDTVSTGNSCLNRMRVKASRVEKRPRSGGTTKTKPVPP